MAIPLNRASTFPVQGTILEPDSLVTRPTIDFEDGGVAVQDTSQGLSGYTWTCFIRGLDIVLQRVGQPEAVLFQTSGVEEVGLAFDQNMRPAVAVKKADGTLLLRWYDSQVQQYVQTPFGTGRCPRLTLDDKRIEMALTSDILFAYIREDGALCYRQQRDRFNTERVLSTGVPDVIRLKNVGMGTNWRIQFELG